MMAIHESKKATAGTAIQEHDDVGAWSMELVD
jgi:hypothetical protein